MQLTPLATPCAKLAPVAAMLCDSAVAVKTMGSNPAFADVVGEFGSAVGVAEIVALGVRVGIGVARMGVALAGSELTADGTFSTVGCAAITVAGSVGTAADCGRLVGHLPWGCMIMRGTTDSTPSDSGRTAERMSP